MSFWSSDVVPISDLTTRQKVAAFATMCVGMFIALLDIQIVSASLRDIGGGLSAGADDTAWVQTSYLIAEIIVIPLSGWLASVVSTRWLFAASALGFTLASLLCALAWNIQSMIAFRAIQGFLGGSMIPMVFTTAFMYFGGKQRVVAASTIGAIASLAPTLGPVIGGWITDISSWHWLFYINLVPGLFVTIVVPIMVRVDKPNLGLLKRADYFSMILLALFLGCLEYTMEEGPRWNWFSDDTIVTTASISALGGAAFIYRSLTVGNPVVDLRALKDRNFALGCLFSFITGIGIFATIYLTPLFLGRVRGYSALDIGLAVFSTGVFQIATIPVYAFLANRFDLRWILMAGLALFAISMWDFTPITHDWGGKELILPQALRGMGQQLCVPPTVTLSLGALAPARLKLASGLFQSHAQSRGCHWHRGLRDHIERSNQFAFSASRRAPQCHERTVEQLARAGSCRNRRGREPGAARGVESYLPRSADHDVFGCVPDAHGRLCRGGFSRSFNAEDCAAGGSFRGCALV
jgi:DHA2 family multidrug resistance protein